MDVVVVGGGPSGSAAALTAARSGARVTLVAESRGRRHSWAGESLPPGADALVRSIFGDGAIDPRSHRTAYGVRGAWGSSDLVDTDFVAHPRGEGWHLDRRSFDRDLRARCREVGVVVIEERAVDVIPTSHGWRVATTGPTIDAGWVVDASGRSPLLGRRMSIRRDVHDDQIAIIGIGDPGSRIAATTVIEAEEEGWWYCTPLPDGHTVVVFLTDHDLQPPVSDRAQWWTDKLARTDHIRDLVGPMAMPPDLRVTWANTTSHDVLHGDRWVLVGDAAIGWDPLSSQGLVTGMLMAARVGQIIGRPHDTTTGSSLLAWSRDYRMLLDEHLGLRRHYWSSETRWPGSPYWSRRHSPGPETYRRRAERQRNR